MQSRTAAPRAHLTAAQVDALELGEGVQRDFGADIVDANNQPIDDLAPDLDLWQVSYAVGSGETIHGSLSLWTTRELDWGRVRVRPWMEFSRDGVTARYYAGVYVPTTPDRTYGRTPMVFEVTGKNLLYLLDRFVGETYVIEADGVLTYHQALRDVVTAAGLSISVRLDGTRQDTVIPADHVWEVGAWTFLDIANDLLAEIAYLDLFCDETGGYRSEPTRPLSERGPEHTFDTADQATDLLAGNVSERLDRFAEYNTWTFVRDGMAYQPVDGDGMYVIPPPDGAPADEITPAPLQTIDVADQAALVAEGDRIAEADRRSANTFSLSVDPFPRAGHRDVVELLLPGRRVKELVTAWSLNPLTRGAWTLGGGGGGEVVERSERQVTGTITSTTANGLRVVVDGAQVDSPATVVADDSGTTPTFSTLGQRVRVTIRAPHIPIVQGAEQ